MIVPALLLGAGVAFLASLIVGVRALVLMWLLLFYAAWLMVVVRRPRLAEVLLSLTAAIFFFAVWPDAPLGDDGAIILKYLDNFARGSFYCYNIADGPIFGISSFVHGIVAGGFAFTRILTPVHSLYVAAFIGLMLACYFSLRLLSLHLGERDAFLFPAWAALMLTADLFLINVKSGMETPIHLAILLACFFFYTRNDNKRFFLLAALAIISKLDATPVVGVLVLAHAARNFPDLKERATRRDFIMQAALYGLAPLLVWVGFSTIVFGSPLPQTAFAKLKFHQSASAHWFPFLESLFKAENRLFLAGVIVGVIAYGVAVVRQVRRKDHAKLFTLFVFLPVVCAYLLLYYIYNPGERMGWYYVVPLFLTAVQAILLFHEFIVKRFHRLAFLFGVLVLAAYSIFYFPRLQRFVQRHTFNTHLIEEERMAIGDWVKNHSQPSDTLLTGFGHVAQRAGLYTIDYSGLNSKIATDLGLDISAIIRRCSPQWIVMDTLLSRTDAAASRYRLRRSFFNLALLGRHTWRVYERDVHATATSERSLSGDMIGGDAQLSPLKGGGVAVEGTRIALTRLSQFADADTIVFGCTKLSSEQLLVLHACTTKGDTIDVRRVSVEMQEPNSFVEGYTQECRIPLTSGVDVLYVEVVHPQGGRVQILNPTIICEHGAARIP
ncbi:MAG: hypothetical protein HY961_13665 [Ignavibacteriae bacterium]|nr:hypothetical protein [Ignavibacteriota bacterium]